MRSIACRALIPSIVVAALLGAGSERAAWAGPIDAPPSVHVRFADLNLTTDEGVQQLYSRLRAAAEQVCGDTSGRGDLLMWREIRKCQSRALDQAVATIHSEKLAARHHRLGATGEARQS